MDWSMTSRDVSHRTPSPGDDIEMYLDDATAPGAEAASEGSPGSASDHMGYMKDVSTADPQPIFPGSADIAAYDRKSGNVEETIGFASSKEDIHKTSSGSLADEKDDGNRRQKRLERNRESARLSRRRRKQYLEDLEKNVNIKAEQLDEARRRHVGVAVSVVQQKRSEVILSMNPGSVPLLDSHLARTNIELMLMTTFQSQQVKSFSLPPQMKMVLWLSLQPEVFFRGGRAASERLSAARIGERILNGGTSKANPARSMWPLLCNEISLSYDQEEKVRSFQRKLLQDQESWLERHSAFASHLVNQHLHDSTQAITFRAGQREKSTGAILSDEQRSKFLSFTARNRALLEKNKPRVPDENSYERRISKENHTAANLYVLSERLNGVLKTVPKIAPLVTGSRLKRLTRRACFESLSSCDEKGMQGSSSSGSMKRSVSEMSMEENQDDNKQSVPAIVPTQAEREAAPVVDKTLAMVNDLLPPRPVVDICSVDTLPSIPSPLPMPTLSYQAPISQSAPQISSLVKQEEAPRSLSQHTRKSSFLPEHLNVVPEEMWPEGDESAEDMLLAMLDGEWAVGEGIDMELA